MKKLLRFCMLCLVLLTICVGSLFAQESTSAGEVTEVDYGAAFTTFGTLMAAIPIVTEALKKVFKVDGGIWAQVIAWLIGIVIALFGYFFDLGLFADYNWWQSILIGLICGFGANGLFDIPLVSWILQTIFGTKKETV